MVNNNKKHLAIGYLAVLALAAALYISTCAPGMLWQDSGVYQYRIWHNDIEGKLGLALSHPLYHIIGIAVKYIPIGEFAYRVNLISAIAAAFAIANLYLLLRLWLNRVFPALLASVTLALSHTMWRHAVIAETYTLYTALFVAELIMLLQYVKTRRVWYLYGLALFSGLAIADHMFASIPLLCYAIFVIVLLVKKNIRLKDLGLIVVLWVAAALPYEYLIVKNIIQSGDFVGTLSSAAFGNNWQGAVLNTSLSSRIVKENLILIAYNFSTFNGLFFFGGLYGLKKVSPSRGFKNILLALLILFFVFAFRYTVPDRYMFFMPFYCVGSVIGGVGFGLLVTQPRRRILRWIVCVLALLPIPTYIIAPVVAQKIQFELPTRRNVPYRNDYTYFLRPWKTGYTGAQRFARQALAQVEKNAIICADSTTVHALLYVQEVKGQRNDVKIVSGYNMNENAPPLTEDIIKQAIESSGVYAVSPKGHCLNFSLDHYDFVQTGVLWKVIERTE